MGKEKNFENRVKKWLREEGCYVVKFYGCGQTRAGVPDLLVCANGRFIAVELKAEDGVVSKVQLAHLWAINEAGGVWFVLKPSGFEDFKNFIRDVMHKC